MLINYLEVEKLLQKLSKQLERLEKQDQASLQQTKKYLTTQQAAEYLQISERSLFNYRRSGLEFVQIGRKIMYSQESLDRFLSEYLVNGQEGGNSDES